MLSYIVSGLALITALSFGAVLLARLPVRVAVVLLAITIVLDAVTWPNNFGAASDSAVSVYLDDLTFLVLLAAGVIFALRRQKLPQSTSWPLFILLALVVLSFIRGASESGIKPAGNGVRDVAYLVAPSISFLLLRPALVLPPQRIAKWFVWFGCGLVILAAARWIGVLPTPQNLVESSSDFREVVRVLPAPLAMIVGQALIAILFLQVTNGIRWSGTLVAGALVVTTIALQHRSVWSSLLVGLAWLAVRTVRRAPKPWLQLAAGALVGVMIAGVALVVTGHVDTVASQVSANVDEPEKADSTWNWRVQGYADATDRLFSGDLFDMLVGPPSGRDLGASASYASVVIHSAYVAALANYGLLGGASFLAWLFIVAKKVGWVRPSREESESWAARAFLQALFLSQLTYFVAYFGELMQGAVLAIILLASDHSAVPVWTSREVRQPTRQRLRIPAVH